MQISWQSPLLISQGSTFLVVVGVVAAVVVVVAVAVVVSAVADFSA